MDVGVAVGLRENRFQEKRVRERQYALIAEDVCHPELGRYHTYGIRVIVSGSPRILHDVSVCEETAKDIVELLNYYQVSPVHMCDIVADMIP